MESRNTIDVSPPSKFLASHKLGMISLFKTLKSENLSVYISVVIFLVLVLPNSRSYLEQSMVSHMLVQLPLLAYCGVLIGNFSQKFFKLKIAYCYSLPLIIVAFTTAMFWMLPRNLDASLAYTEFEILKFITIPLLLGVPLSLGWHNVGAITRSFFITNLLSMLVVLAWLYIEAPVRLCNYYLIDEQQVVGQLILYITGAVILYWCTRIFIGKNKVCE